MGLINTYQDLFPGSTIMKSWPGNGTITIPGAGDARFVCPNSAGCDFVSAQSTAPILYTPLSLVRQSDMPQAPFYVETRLDAFTGTTNYCIAAMTLFTTVGDDPNTPIYSYQFGHYKYEGKLFIGYYTPGSSTRIATSSAVADPSSNHIYRIYWNPYDRPLWIVELNTVLQGNKLIFAYSVDNGSTWVNLLSNKVPDFDFSQAYVGLLSRKWETTAVNSQADFAYFRAYQYDAETAFEVPDAWGKSGDKASTEDAGAVINEGGPARFDLLGATDSVILQSRQTGIEEDWRFPQVSGPIPRYDYPAVRQDPELNDRPSSLEDGLFVQIDQTDYIKAKYDDEGREFLGDYAVRHIFYYDATQDPWHAHGAGFYGAGRDGKLYYDGVACGPGGFGTVAGGLNRTAWAFPDGFLDVGGVAKASEIAMPSDGTLRFTAASTFNQPSSRMRWYLTGDFDIQVDYNIVSAGSGPTDMGIDLNVNIDANNAFYVRRRMFGGNYYARNICNGGTWGSYTQVATSDTSGKLRIVRSGTTMSAYYWGGSSWVQIGTSMTMTYDRPLYVSVGYAFPTVPVGTVVEVSNFAVNSGGVTNLVGWAREPSGAYRGSQGAFPLRAAIVSSGTALDIIDLDYNRLWMSFRQGTNNVLHLFGSGDRYVRSATMRDGVLVLSYRTGPSDNEGGMIWIDFTIDTIRIARQEASTYTGAYYNPELSTGVWSRDSSVGCIAFRNSGRAYSGDFNNWQTQSYQVHWTDLLHYSGSQHRLISNAGGIVMQKWARWKFEGTGFSHISTPYYGFSTETGDMRWSVFDPVSRDIFYHDRAHLFHVHYATWAAVMLGGGGSWVENHSYALSGTVGSYDKNGDAQDAMALVGSYIYYARNEGVYRLDLLTGSSDLAYGKVGSGALYEILPVDAEVVSVAYSLIGTDRVLFVGTSLPDSTMAVDLDANDLYWRGRLDEGHTPYAIDRGLKNSVPVLFRGIGWAVELEIVTHSGNLTGPVLLSASSIDSNTIRLTFDRDLMLEYRQGAAYHAGTLDIPSYHVNAVAGGAELLILRVLWVDSTHVDLLTENQSDQLYRVTTRAGGAMDFWGNVISEQTADFMGQQKADYPTPSETFIFTSGYPGMEANIPGEVYPDLEPPILQNPSPSPGTTDVSPYFVPVLEIIDTYKGVDTLSVLIQFNGVDVYKNGASEPGYTVTVDPILNGYRYTINHAALLPSYTWIVVRAYARDLAPIPNVLDTTFQFQIVDYIAPVIDSNLPIGVGVDENSHVQLSVKDPLGTGVKLSSVQVIINGAYAVANGVAVNDWIGSSITPNLDSGYDIDLVKNSGPYETFEVYTVHSEADDQEDPPNHVELDWGFQVQNYLGPLVHPVDPPNGTTDVDRDTNIQVEVTSAHEVVSGTLQVRVTRGGHWYTAYRQGDTPAFKPGWDGPGSGITPITKGYRITIDPTTDFGYAEYVQVEVSADDPEGNPERLG